MTNRQKLNSMTDEELAQVLYNVIEARELEIRRQMVEDLGIKKAMFVTMAPNVAIQKHIEWLNEECDPFYWCFPK